MQVMARIGKQESGMVLVTVIGVIMVISIFTISFLSQSVSQGKISQDQIDQIKSQVLCSGIIAKAYSDLAKGNAITVPASEVMDGKTFFIDPPTNLTTELTATCSY